ncbi:MAG: hypothetical protein ACK5ZC_09305 [Pirellulaceae bacterium]
MAAAGLPWSFGVGRAREAEVVARKPIPESTQVCVLLKSRRRCCLCFGLNGTDEVKKGQLAHLDGNNENFTEDNLAFLCFEHHDEYDSIPRLSKGLREKEVKQYREQLYRSGIHVTQEVFPAIPDIPSDLALPVGALVDAAMVFRWTFIAFSQGMSLDEMLRDHADILVPAGRALDAWMVKLSK